MQQVLQKRGKTLEDNQQEVCNRETKIVKYLESLEDWKELMFVIKYEIMINCQSDMQPKTRT